MTAGEPAAPAPEPAAPAPERAGEPGTAAEATPKVSVAMPVFNGGDYFALALDSVLAQTYPNFEILVVDDGSADPDEVARIVAAADSPRIRLFRQPNGGVASAMNTAVRHMEGDFLCWLSHDDLYEPHKLASQVAFHAALGCPDAALCSGYRIIGPGGEVIQEVALDPGPPRRAPLLTLMMGYINGCTVLIPARILRGCGPFDTRLRYTQDYDMWNRIAQATDFFLQPERLVRYRVHPGQGTNLPAAAEESNRLWISLIDARTEIERVQLFGSTKRFFDAMARHLAQTPYRQAALYAAERAAAAVEDTLVSVVVSAVEAASPDPRGIESLLRQTHGRLEILLVADGTDDPSPAFLDLLLDPRVRCVAGDGRAESGRNRALDEAQGAYIAFADAREESASDRIAAQLGAMQEAGALACRGRGDGTGAAPAGTGAAPAGTGAARLYPEILARPLVATSTAMIHRALAAAGHRFPPGPAAEWLFWLQVAVGHDVLAAGPPAAPVALARDTAREAVAQVAAFVDADPFHRRHLRQRARLAALAESFGRPEDAAGPRDAGAAAEEAS
ncbi:Undecaprenyl-phosphate 4-deoxy-4-formamido-L-arabinose transferase [Methylobacterium crusticola]|uniref:Undecaprenyl-phosphate 4-deoxy-4-formamido-L-arabinose transferase n=1 Tax=Methylobacterium crusticola TaxID=1697972 RepID=A0ABQ4R3U4_9HYPH|nr:glycosyltransferase [Methylobacterium crusticola]GJD51501.1 Undecaprenyl-phosphate 4-deoxy-4-formamido-L-arabinose transferase [Methylobacterium crusticola]